MITIDNYQDKKSTIDWKAMPKNIIETRNDVEEIMEFYNDDTDIKETVDIFLKQINDNSKPVGEIIVGKLPKIDFVEPEKKPAAPLFLRNDVVKLKPSAKTENPYMFDKYGSTNLVVTSVLTTSKGDMIPGQKNIVKTVKYTYVVLPEGSKSTEHIDEEDLDHVRNANALTSNDVKPKEPTIRETMAATKHLKNVMISYQQNALFGLENSEEKQSFIEKIKKLDQILVDATKIDDVTPVMDKIAKMHFFYGESHWYIFDYTPKDNLFFGYAILNGDTQMSEAGYISVDDLKSIKGMEMDFYFGQKELGKILHSQYSDEFDEYSKEAKTKNDTSKREFIKIKSGVYEIDGITVDLNNKLLDEKHPLMILNYDSPQWIESLREYAQNQNKANAAAKTKAPAKAKVAKVIDKTIVDNLSPEFLLIRRFWNLIKKETISVPFRTVQLLYMAFNKAAVERKVRKTSESAELFTKCNKKIITLFEDFPNQDKKPFEIEFTDKGLYNQIQTYVSDLAVNPAIPALKRFIALQNTKPEIKKAETLLKSINKIFDQDKENRLFDEIKLAKISLSDYVSGRDNKVDLTFYGLSRPVTRSVCTNRIKCAGIDKTGKLHKGYKFQEHTGNIIKVRKGKLASPNVCENRVKCSGLSKTGKLLPGYKFEEGTNHVIKVRKTAKKPAKKTPVKKKVAAGLGLVFNQGIERIYVNQSPIIPIVQNQVQMTQDFDYSALDPRGSEEQSIPVVESVEKEKANVTVNRNSLAYRREKNKNVTHEYYAIENPEIANLLGQIEKKKKESVAITIAGGQGSGKTSFVFQLMNAFAKNYKVGHASIEEHPESALYENKAERFWNDKAKATVDSPEINSMKDIHDLIMRNDVIVIDSFSKLLSMDNKITLDDTFRKKYNGKLFVVIYQLTTDGKMRGGSSSQFDGDIVLFVEKFPDFNDNYVFADKNRYQNRSLDELHYNIASAKLVINEPEPILEFTEVERI